MPVQDGLEVIMTLHREKPTISIIAITGNEGKSFFNRGKAAGRSAHPGETIYPHGFDSGCTNSYKRCDASVI